MTAEVIRASGGRGAGSRRDRRRRSGDETVPPMEVRTYYDQPVITPPVWTWEIPVYFFVGGMAGASSVLAVLAEAAGDRRLARVSRVAAGVGALVSPPLLIKDLGMPSRFYNMLRVFRPTSPMSVGSWLLAAYGPAAAGAAGLEVLGRAPRLKALAGGGAATFGPGLATYTAVLFANTAVPVWHEARGQLPALFAASGMASAGAVGVVFAPGSETARVVALVGAAGELLASNAMEHHLEELGVGQPYEEGTSGTLQKAATTATALGAALVALPGRRRRHVGGAALLLAGAMLERWAVFTAGFASAKDPSATVRLQRERLAQREA